MASVKKFPGSAIWYACYRTAAGKRRQESTGKADHDEALAIAMAYERAADHARAGLLTDERARSFLAQCRAITGSTSSDALPAETWLRAWAEKTSRRLKPKSARKYTDTIDDFLVFLGPEARTMLHAIRPHQVAAWRDNFLTLGRVAKTANVHLGILTQAFREAQAQHLCEHNPCAGLALHGAETGNVRRRPFTLEQFTALLRVVDAEWRTFLMLLGLTGARQQEAAQLRWEQVDFNATPRIITLIRGKQRDRPHVVPMHPALLTALDAAHLQAASVFVLPKIAATAGKQLSKKFRQQILPRIGIKQPYGGRPGGKVAARYSLHSLRHSLASWGDVAGMTSAQRRDILGHEDGLINERYTHTTLAALHTALARIPVDLSVATG